MKKNGFPDSLGTGWIDSLGIAPRATSNDFYRFTTTQTLPKIDLQECNKMTE